MGEVETHTVLVVGCIVFGSGYVDRSMSGVFPGIFLRVLGLCLVVLEYYCAFVGWGAVFDLHFARYAVMRCSLLAFGW